MLKMREVYRHHSNAADRASDLTFAMNHVRFMISPELYVVLETLAFDI